MSPKKTACSSSIVHAGTAPVVLCSLNQSNPTQAPVLVSGGDDCLLHIYRQPRADSSLVGTSSDSLFLKTFDESQSSIKCVSSALNSAGNGKLLVVCGNDDGQVLGFAQDFPGVVESEQYQHSVLFQTSGSLAVSSCAVCCVRRSKLFLLAVCGQDSKPKLMLINEQAKRVSSSPSQPLGIDLCSQEVLIDSLSWAPSSGDTNEYLLAGFSLRESTLFIWKVTLSMVGDDSAEIKLNLTFQEKFAQRMKCQFSVQGWSSDARWLCAPDGWLISNVESSSSSLNSLKKFKSRITHPRGFEVLVGARFNRQGPESILDKRGFDSRFLATFWIGKTQPTPPPPASSSSNQEQSIPAKIQVVDFKRWLSDDGADSQQFVVAEWEFSYAEAGQADDLSGLSSSISLNLGSFEWADWRTLAFAGGSFGELSILDVGDELLEALSNFPMPTEEQVEFNGGGGLDEVDSDNIASAHSAKRSRELERELADLGNGFDAATADRDGVDSDMIDDYDNGSEIIDSAYNEAWDSDGYQLAGTKRRLTSNSAKPNGIHTRYLPQAPFQPTSTPVFINNRRFLAYNKIGWIELFVAGSSARGINPLDGDSMSAGNGGGGGDLDEEDSLIGCSITIKFHDQSRYPRPIQFKSIYNLSMGCMSSRGALFAARASTNTKQDDTALPSTLYYKPFEVRSTSAEWTHYLPSDEQAVLIACTNRVACILTSQNLLRLFDTGSGCQLGTVVSVCAPGPAVSMTAYCPESAGFVDGMDMDDEDEQLDLLSSRSKKHTLMIAHNNMTGAGQYQFQLWQLPTSAAIFNGGKTNQLSPKLIISPSQLPIHPKLAVLGDGSLVEMEQPPKQPGYQSDLISSSTNRLHWIGFSQKLGLPSCYDGRRLYCALLKSHPRTLNSVEWVPVCDFWNASVAGRKNTSETGPGSLYHWIVGWDEYGQLPNDLDDKLVESGSSATETTSGDHDGGVQSMNGSAATIGMGNTNSDNGTVSSSAKTSMKQGACVDTVICKSMRQPFPAVVTTTSGQSGVVLFKVAAKLPLIPSAVNVDSQAQIEQQMLHSWLLRDLFSEETDDATDIVASSTLDMDKCILRLIMSALQQHSSLTGAANHNQHQQSSSSALARVWDWGNRLAMEKSLEFVFKMCQKYRQPQLARKFEKLIHQRRKFAELQLEEEEEEEDYEDSNQAYQPMALANSKRLLASNNHGQSAVNQTGVISGQNSDSRRHLQRGPIKAAEQRSKLTTALASNPRKPRAPTIADHKRTNILSEDAADEDSGIDQENQDIVNSGSMVNSCQQNSSPAVTKPPPQSIGNPFRLQSKQPQLTESRSIFEQVTNSSSGQNNDQNFSSAMSKKRKY